MPGAKAQPRFMGKAQPHEGRKRGTNHRTRLYTPAPAAYAGIDAYTHPNAGGTLKLDTKSQRATSLLMRQPGLPEGISKAKAANPGPGHYERYDAQHVLLPVAPSYSQERSKREDSQIIVSPGLHCSRRKATGTTPARAPTTILALSAGSRSRPRRRSPSSRSGRASGQTRRSVHTKPGSTTGCGASASNPRAKSARRRRSASARAAGASSSICDVPARPRRDGIDLMCVWW